MSDEGKSAAAKGSPQAAAAASQPPAGDGAAGADTGKGAAGAKDGQAASAPAADYKLDPVNLPDHFKVNDARMARFTDFAKSKSLTQAEAQGLVDLFVESGADLGKAVEAQLAQDHDAEVAKWKDQARADKEIGGAAFDANLAVAQSAIARFGTPEFKALLDAYGLGDHPEVIRAFLKVGKQISEGSHVQAGGSGPAVKSAAEAIYNHPTSKATLKFDDKAA